MSGLGRVSVLSAPRSTPGELLYGVLDPGVVSDDVLQVQPTSDDLVLLYLEQTDPTNLKRLATTLASKVRRQPTQPLEMVP